MNEEVADSMWVSYNFLFQKHRYVYRYHTVSYKPELIINYVIEGWFNCD
jgi:hypothetical protein